MDYVYLIVNENSFLLKKSIDKVISKYKDSEIVYYDLKESTLENAIEDLDTYNFLSNRKIVILINCGFLTSEKGNDIDTSILEKYVKNPNKDNILIITSEKLDERKSIVKLIKSNAKIIEEVITPEKLIKDNLDNYKMDNDAVNTLINYTLGNYDRIINELEKLKLYKYDYKIIEKKDVEELVQKDIDDNIFSLIDAIIKKDKKYAYSVYQEILTKSNDVNKILVMLANKFRLLYQVKVLSKNRYNDNDIGKIIGSHPYPVKLARSLIYEFSEKDLLSYLKKLSVIDYEIKTGKTYKNIALEMFIMSL